VRETVSNKFFSFKMRLLPTTRMSKNQNAEIGIILFKNNLD